MKIAALLIHAARIDEKYSIEEEEIIKKTLLDLGTDQNELETIIKEAKQSEKNTNQILDFTKEIKKLQEKEIDIAVHALKDLPVIETKGLTQEDKPQLKERVFRLLKNDLEATISQN